MALSGEVERAVVVRAARRHRADVAVLRVDRDDRRARVARIASCESIALAPATSASSGRSSYRPSGRPGGRCSRRTVDQLLLDVVEEERLTDACVEVAAFRPRPFSTPWSRGRRCSRVGHLGQDVVPAPRGARVLERVHSTATCGSPPAAPTRRASGPWRACEERLPRPRRRPRCGRRTVPKGTEFRYSRGSILRVLVLELLGQLGLTDLALDRPLRVLDRRGCGRAAA